MKVSVGSVFTYRSMMIVMLMIIIIIIILYHLYHSNSHNLSLICSQQRSSTLSLISPLCYCNIIPCITSKLKITFNRRKYHCFQGSSFNVDPFVSVAEATNTGNWYYVCIPHHHHYHHQYHHQYHHHHLYQHLHYHHHTHTHPLQYSAVISLTIIIIIASLLSSSSFSSS